MAQDRPNVKFVGKGKDRFGFEVDVLRDEVTGTQYAAYSIETWIERCRFLTEVAKLTERNDGSTDFAA